MALFGKKKKEEQQNEAVKTTAVEERKGSTTKKQASTSAIPGLERDLSSVIVRPRITEKAVLGTERNVYTFEVRKGATKHDVRDAIKATYNVTPVKINIVNKQPRHYTSRLRGRKMLEKGMKKAYVYLKEGDRIDLV